MDLSLTHFLLLGAAFCAGVLNAIAGGGTLLLFPALIAAGMPPVIANATSTLSQWPGYLASAWALRHALLGDRNGLIMLSVMALVGGALGAALLLALPSRLFDQLVPILILLATVAFALGPRWLKNRQARPMSLPKQGVLQCLTAMYGGFFNGGLGILLLAQYALSGMQDMARMQALKAWASLLISAAAVVLFASAGTLDWAMALWLMLGTVAGGMAGGVLIRYLPSQWVRYTVIAIGGGLTVVFSWRVWGA